MNQGKISAIYDSLWNEAENCIRCNQPECDDFLCRKEQDKRRGLSVVCRPNECILQRFRDFIHKAEQLEPHQYYYDPQELHITVLSIISCYDGFDLKNKDPEAYTGVIEKSIQQAGPMKITFHGITASKSCVMLQGFPKNEELELLRGRLRDNFRTSGLEASIDQRYTLQTAHSTVIRFGNPFLNPGGFADFLKQYREFDFGVTEIGEVEFYFNDWYMSEAVSTKLACYSLKSGSRI
ncbi:MAG: mutarotase [Clostridia bacterium]|nr:mutarotase [Clostridia bacterium]